MRPNPISRHEAAEAVKDLIVNERRSRWPAILGALFLLCIAGGVGYWFYLPPERRPPLEPLIARAKDTVQNVLNAPVLSSSKSPHMPAGIPAPDAAAPKDPLTPNMPSAPVLPEGDSERLLD